jgi:hypothetical protein
MLRLLLAALIVLFGAPAIAAPIPSDQVCTLNFPIVKGGTTYQFRHCGDQEFGATGNATVTSAWIIVHGTDRDAVRYTVNAATQKRSNLGLTASQVLIIGPQFLSNEDTAAHGHPADVLRWVNHWEGGADSQNTPSVSSYEVIDQILTRLSDRTAFPNLQQVILAGHSSGGQFWNRYAFAMAKPDTHLKIRIVGGNPSSYLYLDDRRRVGDVIDTFAAVDAAGRAACPDFNRWRYGFEPYGGVDVTFNYIGAKSLDKAKAIGNFLSWDEYVFYAGSNDTQIACSACAPGDNACLSNCSTSLCDTCTCAMQGDERRERMWTYFNYLQQTIGAPFWRVARFEFGEGCSHQGECMFRTAPASTALWTAPVRGAYRCAGDVSPVTGPTFPSATVVNDSSAQPTVHNAQNQVFASRTQKQDFQSACNTGSLPTRARPFELDNSSSPVACLQGGLFHHEPISGATPPDPPIGVAGWYYDNTGSPCGQVGGPSFDNHGASTPTTERWTVAEGLRVKDVHEGADLRYVSRPCADPGNTCKFMFRDSWFQNVHNSLFDPNRNQQVVTVNVLADNVFRLMDDLVSGNRNFNITDGEDKGSLPHRWALVDTVIRLSPTGHQTGQEGAALFDIAPTDSISMRWTANNLTVITSRPITGVDLSEWQRGWDKFDRTGCLTPSGGPSNTILLTGGQTVAGSDWDTAAYNPTLHANTAGCWTVVEGAEAVRIAEFLIRDKIRSFAGNRLPSDPPALQ